MMLRPAAAFTLRAVCAGVLSSATILQVLASPIAGASGHFTSGDPPARTEPPAWVAFKRAWTGIVGYSAAVTIFEKKGAQVQHVVFEQLSQAI